MSFAEREQAFNKLAKTNSSLKSLSTEWLRQAGEAGQQYTWDWCGLPIIQISQDIVQYQELIQSVKPDLIVETGIARGGSLALSASLLCLLDIMEGLDPRLSSRKVVGVDIDIRDHNRKALDAHPLRFKMHLIEGSSIDSKTIEEVRSIASEHTKILLALDSNHTHDHVFAELEAYADLVSLDSYCIVFDTVIADLPADYFPDRPWGIDSNPKSAVHDWLKYHPEFQIDKAIDDKLLISVAPNGYLKRIH
tara:strand:- start:773 stop:1522 length:750 start_codon:yes stop_codon:yes gene_type:complete